jgi:hypothetical protein
LPARNVVVECILNIIKESTDLNTRYQIYDKAQGPR